MCTVIPTARPARSMDKMEQGIDVLLEIDVQVADREKEIRGCRLYLHSAVVRRPSHQASDLGAGDALEEIYSGGCKSYEEVGYLYTARPQYRL
ncbi:MAG: hypothetical protein U0231_16490 [Nitrospiraceae bacterium]